MKIADALRILAQVPDRPPAAGGLSPSERAALIELLGFVRRVREVRPQIRRLANIVDPDTHLNQQDLFGDTTEGQADDEA